MTSRSTVLFSTELLMWPVLKGPEGLDQPRCLLSKQSSQSWTSQLQLQLWTVDYFVYIKKTWKETMAVNCWLFCISERTHCQNLWKSDPTIEVNVFFQWFSLMDNNIKGTVNGCKNIKPLNLDALFSMVRLGLVWIKECIVSLGNFKKCPKIATCTSE